MTSLLQRRVSVGCPAAQRVRHLGPEPTRRQQPAQASATSRRWTIWATATCWCWQQIELSGLGAALRSAQTGQFYCYKCGQFYLLL